MGTSSHKIRSQKPKKQISNTYTWYIKTTIMGNSANTFRERDPLGMMECCQKRNKQDCGYHCGT